MPQNLTDPFHKMKGDDAQEPDRRRRAVEQVRRFMQKSDEYRRPFLDLAEKAAELYRVWERTSQSPIHRANLKLPYAYQLIETEVPQIANQFLKYRPPFKLRGRDPQDMLWEDDLTDFLGMQLDQMQFSPKFLAFLKSCAIHGTAVAKVPYRYTEKVVTKREVTLDPLLGMPLPTKREELAATFDGPDFELIDLKDFFPDWTVRSPADIEGMRGAVHRTWKTWSELKAREKKGGQEQTGPGYSNLAELERSISAKGCAAWKDPYYKSDYTLSDERSEDIKKKPIEIWEYWGLFDPAGDGKFVEYVIAVANGDVCIRCDVNFYDYRHKPFVAQVNVPWPNEFYGISELFAVRGSIKEATALRNARLDQINLAVNRQWVVDRASGVNSRALYARTNGIIWTNDIKGIQPLPPPEVPPSAFREIQELGSEIQMTAGSMSGPDLSEAARVFGRSATGASGFFNTTTSRAGLKSKLVSEIFFKRFVRLMLMINAQYVSDAQWVRSSDPNRPNPFTQLPADAFHCDYDYELAAGAEADPQEEFQRLQLGMQFFQTAEQTQPGLIKYDVVFDSIGRALFGKQFKKFVRSEAEMQQMQAQKLAMEQAANAAAGQAAPQPNAPGGAGAPEGGGLF